MTYDDDVKFVYDNLRDIEGIKTLVGIDEVTSYKGLEEEFGVDEERARKYVSKMRRSSLVQGSTSPDSFQLNRTWFGDNVVDALQEFYNDIDGNSEIADASEYVESGFGQMSWNYNRDIIRSIEEEKGPSEVLEDVEGKHLDYSEIMDRAEHLERDGMLDFDDSTGMLEPTEKGNDFRTFDEELREIRDRQRQMSSLQSDAYIMIKRGADTQLVKDHAGIEQELNQFLGEFADPLEI